MEGLNNHTYIVLLTISNIVAILQLIASLKWPWAARWSFFLLFIIAGFANWSTSQNSPHSYLEYGNLAWSHAYKVFINGWFAGHIQLMIGLIALCQFLIAISILFLGILFKIGCIGAIIFLIAILPLGIGSGFPCTAIMAVAVYFLLRMHSNASVFDKL